MCFARFVFIWQNTLLLNWTVQRVFFEKRSPLIFYYFSCKNHQTLGIRGGFRGAGGGQNFSKKCQKTPFLVFFQSFACGAQKLTKAGSFWYFRKAWKINLVDLKKVDKNFENFFEIRPSPR